MKRLREAYLCEYNIDKKYGYKFALEANPNEPRADIFYMATIGHYLGCLDAMTRTYDLARLASNRRSGW